MTDSDLIAHAAQKAYTEWQTYFMSPTPWSLLDPYAQETWRKVAYAAITAHNRETTR